MTNRLKTIGFAAVAAVALPAAAMSAHIDYYLARVAELNGSGVSGNVFFEVNRTDETLTVTANVGGLEPGMLHLNHIHGRFNPDGSLRDSVVPPSSADTDGDGFVEVLEGAPFYGDILLSLEDPDNLPGAVHTGPSATATGRVFYSNVYDLTDDSLFFSPVSGTDYTAEDVVGDYGSGSTSLQLREYVIHGLTVPGGVNDGLPDGGYLATLPVGAAAIISVASVPLPAGGLLLLGAMGGLAALRRRKARG